jgi:L-lactate dehydrogenase complex protein LldE
MPPPDKNPNVALFVTCLVDLIRPRVGFAAVTLLERAGCTVSVPPTQTCCGQPAYNSGDRILAKRIAAQVIDAFAGYDYIVAPSGSCAGMIKVHFPELFRDEPDLKTKAESLAERTFELTQFLSDVLGYKPVDISWSARAVYHDSCSGLRELGVKNQPRQLLANVAGLRLTDYSGSETCCGFGGTFAVKYPAISDRIVAERTREIGAVSDAEMIVGGDLGCLLNLAGKLQRDGSSVRVRHIAEVLAGDTGPAIGEAERA